MYIQVSYIVPSYPSLLPQSKMMNWFDCQTHETGFCSQYFFQSIPLQKGSAYNVLGGLHKPSRVGHRQALEMSLGTFRTYWVITRNITKSSCGSFKTPLTPTDLEPIHPAPFMRLLLQVKHMKLLDSIPLFTWPFLSLKKHPDGPKNPVKPTIQVAPVAPALLSKRHRSYLWQNCPPFQPFVRGTYARFHDNGTRRWGGVSADHKCQEVSKYPTW